MRRKSAAHHGITSLPRAQTALERVVTASPRSTAIGGRGTARPRRGGPARSRLQRPRGVTARGAARGHPQSAVARRRPPHSSGRVAAWRHCAVVLVVARGEHKDTRVQRQLARRSGARGVCVPSRHEHGHCAVRGRNRLPSAGAEAQRRRRRPPAPGGGGAAEARRRRENRNVRGTPRARRACAAGDRSLLFRVAALARAVAVLSVLVLSLSPLRLRPGNRSGRRARVKTVRVSR